MESVKSVESSVLREKEEGQWHAEEEEGLQEEKEKEKEKEKRESKCE